MSFDEEVNIILEELNYRMLVNHRLEDMYISAIKNGLLRIRKEK